jgi:hypothetical protein
VRQFQGSALVMEWYKGGAGKLQALEWALVLLVVSALGGAFALGVKRFVDHVAPPVLAALGSR